MKTFWNLIKKHPLLTLGIAVGGALLIAIIGGQFKAKVDEIAAKIKSGTGGAA